MSDVTLFIPIISNEQLNLVHLAEHKMLEAGITFDTESLIVYGMVVARQWFLDQSLKGARVEGGKPE